jgi:hypothetical protein
MPKCINDPTRNYNGTEPSPKGLGYCAHVEKVGTIRIGKDNNAWIVKMSSNKIKKWVIKSKEFTKQYGFVTSISMTDPRLKSWSVRKKQNLLKLCNLQDKFKEMGVTFLIYIWSDWQLTDDKTHVNQPRDDLDWYWDQPWEDIPEKLFYKPFILVPIKYDTIYKKYILDGKKNDEISLFHNLESHKKEKQNVIKLFSKLFKERFFWSGKHIDPINIKLI